MGAFVKMGRGTKMKRSALKSTGLHTGAVTAVFCWLWVSGAGDRSVSLSQNTRCVTDFDFVAVAMLKTWRRGSFICKTERSHPSPEGGGEHLMAISHRLLLTRSHRNMASGGQRPHSADRELGMPRGSGS